MKKYILITAYSMLISTAAHAGLYLEPYVGYAIGSSEGTVTIESVGVSTVDSDEKVTAFGGKVGYSILGLAFGADYAKLSYDSDDKTSDNLDTESDETHLGAFVQYTLPILFKVSATYILNAKSKSDESESNGKGLKIGVGFTGLPFVSINLDLITLNYDDVDVDGVTVSSADVDTKLTMLSVSLPLDF